MKDLLYAVLGLLSVAGAAYFMYWYVTQPRNDASSMPFIGFVVFAILAIVFGALFLFGKVNKHEEIHITE